MNKVKEFRIKKNMTQEELSLSAGVSRNTISLIENDKPVNLQKKTMESIATALGSTVKQIFFNN